MTEGKGVDCPLDLAGALAVEARAVATRESNSWAAAVRLRRPQTIAARVAASRYNMMEPLRKGARQPAEKKSMENWWRR